MVNGKKSLWKLVESSEASCTYPLWAGTTTPGCVSKRNELFLTEEFLWSPISYYPWSGNNPGACQQYSGTVGTSWFILTMEDGSVMSKHSWLNNIGEKHVPREHISFILNSKTDNTDLEDSNENSSYMGVGAVIWKGLWCLSGCLFQNTTSYL